MRQESILRQVALVSYGTQFLRGALALEDWYRHHLFSDARLQFRELAGNALLADGFTLWLDSLKQSGAMRLSLHPAAEFNLATPAAAREADHAVVAHFKDRYQIWAAGEEHSAWTEEPPSFNAMSGGYLDSYWLAEERPGALDVADTDWKQLTAAIAADLDITIPSSLAPTGLFFASAPEPEGSARLPLFPSSRLAYAAHRMLATLNWEQSRFANDANPKNENSRYKMLDDAGVAAAENWSARLNSWVIEVLLRSANEYRESAIFARSAPLVRRHAPAPPRMDQAAPAGDAVAEPPEPSGKWRGRIVAGVAIAALSLLILYVAKIIAAFPWLSVLLGLPLALYAKYRKS